MMRTHFSWLLAALTGSLRGSGAYRTVTALHRIGACILVTSFGLTPHCAFAGSATLLFEGDFEDGSLANYKIIGGNPVISMDRARAGSRALKSVITYPTSGTFGSVRAETMPLTPNGPYIVNQYPIIGQDYWYGFSIFLPSDFVPSTIWEIVAQWHVNPDPGEGSRNPAMTITTTGGVWAVHNRWDDNAITPRDANDKPIYGGQHDWDLGAYTMGVWTDWVFHVKWSYTAPGNGADGILEVWKNGTKVITQLNYPNCYNDTSAPYLKLGIYKGWSSAVPPEPRITTRTVYHDEYRFAGANGSYDAVVPSVRTAMPKPPSIIGIGAN